MIIELMRAETPENVGREEECAICARRFRTEVVLAMPWTEGGSDLEGKHACPACVEALGRYLPEKFPTIEEYEAAKRRFLRPLFASYEEAVRAGERGPAYELEILAASRIERAGAR